MPSPATVVGYKPFENVVHQGHFHVLPLDIILDIAVHLSISDIVLVSRACRSIRNFFLDNEVFNVILRAAVLSPTGTLRYAVSIIDGSQHSDTSIRWLLPVRGICEESERAASVAHAWLAASHAATKADQLSLPPRPSNDLSPFLYHAFPYHLFVPACLLVNTTVSSMSMSNRKRFWGIIKQYEVIWREYRTRGWERGEIFSKFNFEEWNYYLANGESYPEEEGQEED
jgi:hypothetical protein